MDVVDDDMLLTGSDSDQTDTSGGGAVLCSPNSVSGAAERVDIDVANIVHMAIQQVPTSCADPKQFISGCLNAFLDANSVPLEVAARLSGIIGVFGSEKAGKSTAQSNLAQAPIFYTDGNTATVVAFSYLIRYDPSVTETTATVVDPTGANRTGTYPFTQLFDVTKAINTHIINNHPGGVSDRVVSIDVRTNNDTQLVMRQLDLPGTVGDVADPRFSRGVQRMAQDHVQRVVLPPGSHSHLIVCLPWGENLRTKTGWKEVLLPQGADLTTAKVDCPRVHLLLTKTQNITAANVRQWLRSNGRLPFSDKGFITMVKKMHKFDELFTDAVSIHIVDNEDAECADPTDFADVCRELEEGQRNRDLRNVIAALRQQPGYVQDDDEGMLSMFGIEPLREISYRCQVEGLSRQVEFIDVLLQRQEKYIEQRALAIQEQTKALAQMQAGDVGRLVVEAFNKLQHINATGHWTEITGNPFFPSFETFKRVGDKYARLLSEEFQPESKEHFFEASMMPEIVRMLHTDAEMPTFPAATRIQRAIPVTILLALLASPAKITRRELSVFQSMAKKEMASGSMELISNHLTKFSGDLVDWLKEYIEGYARQALQDCVKATREMIELGVPDLTRYFDACPGRDANIRRLFDDLETFFGNDFVERNLEKMTSALNSAKAPLRDCIAAYVPQLVTQVPSLMPEMRATEQFHEHVTGGRALSVTKPLAMKLAGTALAAMANTGPVAAVATAAMSAINNSDMNQVSKKMSKEVKKVFDETPRERLAKMAVLAPYIVNSDGPAAFQNRWSSTMEVREIEVDQVNAALKQHAVVLGMLVAIQLPLTVMKPFVTDVVQKAQELDYLSFAEHIQGPQNSREMQLFPNVAPRHTIAAPPTAAAASSSSAASSSAASATPPSSSPSPTAPQPADRQERLALLMYNKYKLRNPKDALLDSERDLHAKHVELQNVRETIAQYKAVLAVSAP